MDGEAPGSWGLPHMATPDGRVIGFGGRMEPYNGRFSRDVQFVSYDIYSGSLDVRQIPEPFPSATPEGRPFCFVPDKRGRGRVFVLEPSDDAPCRTWIYDISANAFTDLDAANAPTGRPGAVEYINGQGVAFAIVGDAQWVYSFERNRWARLPLKVAGGATPKFSRPYTQVVYSAKYGVLVNLPGTELMRFDGAAVRWK